MTYNLDGITYHFNSKYPELNYLYGINEDDIIDVDNQINKQIDYLKRNIVTFEDANSYRSFFEMSHGANIRPDIYYAELWNRVNSLKDYAEYLKFTQPIFFTVTVPSYLQPLTQIELKKNVYKIIDNKNWSGEYLSVDIAYKFLSKKWSSFIRNNRVFTEIKKKYGERYVYMKVYEPMKDATPHLHAVMFVPSEYTERIKKLFLNQFHESITDIKTEFNGDLGGVVAYILKYVLKTFKNSKTGKLDLTAYWYAKHRIIRFTSSRSLMPLSYLRLINSHEEYQDFFKSTLLYKNGNFELEFEAKNNADFDKLSLSDCNLKSIVNSAHDERELIYLKSSNYELEEFKAQLPMSLKLKLCEVDVVNEKNEKIARFDENNNLKMLQVHNSPQKMSDYELIHYFNSLDSETVNFQHYGNCKNEMIRRGMMQGNIESLNEYNSNNKF